MPLIDDYKQCLIDVVQNARSIENYTFAKGRLNTQLVSETEALAKLKSSAEERLANEYMVQLERILSEKTAGLVQQRDSIANQLQSIPMQMQAKRTEILNSNFSDTYAMQSSRVSALEDFAIRENVRFANVDHRLDTSIESQSGSFTLSLDQMEYLMYNLGKRFEEMSPKDYVAPIEKIANLICWDSSFLKTLLPFHQVCLYTVWLLIVICLTLWSPLFVILPYGGFYLWSVLQSSRHVNAMLNLYYPFRILSVKIQEYKQGLLDSIEAEKQRHLSALDTEERVRVGRAQKLLEQAERDLVAERERIRQTTPEEELTAAVRQSLDNTLHSKEEYVASLKRQVAENATQLSQAQHKRQKLEELKDKLKRELTETYLSPKTPGDSKILPESFFLGFDNEGALMEFNYEGKSTMVEYHGPSSASVRDLIMMMVVQLLMAMDITCVSISFIDTDSGGFDYAVFCRKDLDSVFEIISTDEAATKLVESMHAEQRARSSQILVNADNILEYNKAMIQRKSFTKDYRILIFQTISKKVMEDDKFKQLCKNGPRVGIIPIVFISKATMLEYKDSRFEERIKFAEFLESINSQIFVYDSATSNLEPQVPNYRDALLQVYRRKDAK